MAFVSASAATVGASSPVVAGSRPATTFLPGDGIGDDIMGATVKVLEAVASRFDSNLSMT